MSFRIVHGDCTEVLRGMADCSVDAVVTDPPYGLAFMGKKWDYDVPSVEVWTECLRVLKPGGYLLAFSGTRTQHRMVCAIEDAGFEIRDQIGWAFGSGFPKSHNGEWGGTALKPAWEPICMARKPLIGTVEANWREHGTGALNIDGCRIEADARAPITGRGGIPARHAEHESRPAGVVAQPHELGRWPANLIHDGSDEVLSSFPLAPGQIADAKRSGERKTANVYGTMRYANGRDGEASASSDNDGAVGFKMKPGARRADAGSAARFFYCAKASRSDRNAGTESLPQRVAGMVSNTSGQHITRRDEGYEQKPQGNHHPTVKPTDLMRYLCRLVTPPGGVVLDPFMGSGSTGKAAVLEGFGFVGIEREAEYVEIARQRISSACLPLFAEVAHG